MKLRGGFLIHPRELCNRMHIFVSTWMLPLMTSHLCILILSSLAVSSQMGLEDVFFSPHDQTVREGEGVFFQCVSGESSPPASITWLKDGTLVKRGRPIQGEYGGGNQKKTSGTLHLFNVTLEDDGMYICVTHNALLNISKRSKPAKLTVQGVPRKLQIIQGPDNITAAMGTEVSMHCDVDGFPVPMVHWFKDGCLLANCSASFSLHNNGQLLTFRNVTKEDEGSYHCEASNQKESIKSQSAFLLPAEMDWRFIQQPTNLTVRRGENATVTCRPPYSKPAAQVSWFKNNHLLTPTAHSTVLPSGDLFFTSVQEFDSGSYFCRASNIHLQRFLTSRRAALTVQAPPSVKLWPQVLTVPVGARVVLECQVSGHPLPSISWVKRGHSKQTGGKIALGLRNATLCIQSARSYDEGVYVCEASNTLGRSHNTAMLRVAVSPIIVTSVGQVSCRIGASAVFPCKAVGILPITYNWTKGRAETESPISFNEGKHIDEDGALHISSVQYYDAGEYYCTAENRAGRHQRRTILTVTAEHHPADKGRQTRLVLSASNNTSKRIPAYQTDESVVEQHPKTTHQPRAKTQRDEATCSLSHCDTTTSSATTSSTVPRGAVAELKMPRGSHGRLLQHHLSQPTTKPTQPLVTQMQPPMLPPPPHPNFQSVHFHAHSQTLAVTSKALDTTVQYVPVLTEHLSHLTLTSSRTQFEHQGSDVLLMKPDWKGSKIHAVTLASQITEFITKTSVPQPTNPPVGRSFSSLMLDSYLPTTNQSPETNNSGSSTVPTASQEDPTQLHQLVTENEFHQSYHQPTLTQISQTKLEDLGRPLQQRTHSPTPSQIPPSVDQQSFTQRLFPKFHHELPTTQHYLASTQPSPTSATKPQQFNSQPLPALSRPTSTISTLPQNRPRPSPTQHPLVHAQSPPPQTEAFPVQRRQPSIPTLHPPNQTSHPSTSAPEIRFVHLVNTSDQVQLNNSQQGDTVQSVKTPNDTELTEWLKRNTSQSPMTSNDPRVTQQSPSWLPVLEKHDIPIVVGVGVSLAFIFITVTFYSVVQKNEPAPTSRAAQRNLGVPLRHAERRAAGRTYENRAFEDDDCVAVIEQSPNTSETRARPPGPSLVTVQMEPTFEDLQDDTQPAPDNHSVTVETYPEPILDTKIDPCLEEEKGRSLSQPSIQLQCTEDWTSNRGDNRSPCQDALPPPSSLPSRSPSPSPPSRPGEGLRSSLTLQSAEACAAPIHHSLSISHGNPPLLLSHHVSLGLTTVAVDVHFYPAATASMAVCTSTHINSVANSTSAATPLFTPPLVNSQDNDQSAARYPQSK